MQFTFGSKLIILAVIIYSLNINANDKVINPTLEFIAILPPQNIEEKLQIRAVSAIKLNTTTYPIAYHKLLRTGEILPKLEGNSGETEIFAALKAANGQSLLEADGTSKICVNTTGPDHTYLLNFGTKLFAVVQLECAPGGAYITELKQSSTGILEPIAIRAIDFSNAFGTYVNCAGSITPWKSLLSSEEYELPMAKFDAAAFNGNWFGSLTAHNLRAAGIAEYLGQPNDAIHAATFGYYHGWIPEITVTSETGNTSVTKHFAMGRISHEVGHVMPDKRTVYLTDDGTNVGLFMFIADKPETLSAGILYAAKWQQLSAINGGSANLEWINLGHSTNAEIEAALQAKITFGDMWEQAVPLNTEAATCPAGFVGTNTYDIGFICIKLREGKEKLASRLETRLYAAYLGATTEFRKEEGIAYNPVTNTLYVAMTEISRGMEDGAKHDLGGPNHIRLPKNLCGAVYELKLRDKVLDNKGNTIASQFVAVDMRGLVIGEPNTNPDIASIENGCNVNKIAGADNLAYLPKYDLLMIGEDTDQHQNCTLWVYNVTAKRLDRIATVPLGAEVTATEWYPNIGGFGYMTLVTQHPFRGIANQLLKNTTHRHSEVGYIGPFPPLN